MRIYALNNDFFQFWNIRFRISKNVFPVYRDIDCILKYTATLYWVTRIERVKPTTVFLCGNWNILLLIE